MNGKLKSLVTEVKLLPSIAQKKRDRDRQYLMELTNQNLLFSFYTEAGLNGTHAVKDPDIHWGWDGPLSQIRGTFTGHWLSAAARMVDELGDLQLKEKANFIVAEIARCQQANGKGWAFPIPEKYLHKLKEGQHFWAPQYVCHKVMMGLLDMYQFAGNKQALEILSGCTDWFYDFTNGVSRETMNMMMDIEETGAIMEVWGDLYAVTNDPRHLELARRYERPSLTQPVLDGVDVLTNLHANTTTPEIHGCARAYEVTGEERYRKIVEQYWKMAVSDRGYYATGGQNSGEIWTPNQKLASRLGDMNQEHCTVYNMIRLADYLYRWSGDKQYLDYIELNIINGLYAQGFWNHTGRNMLGEDPFEDSTLVTYYLPMEAGSHKTWGSKTDDFWCCHCTLVQANARYREFIYYQDDSSITVAQYMPSTLETTIAGAKVTLRQTNSDLAGENITIHQVARELQDRPSFIRCDYAIEVDKPAKFALRFRLPWWLKSKPTILLNGKAVQYQEQDGYAVVEHQWSKDTLVVELPKGLSCSALPDEPNTVAFMDGPVVLAGLIETERLLVGDIADPSTMLKPHNERRWTAWLDTYKTVNQDFGFYLKPLYDIGHETYTVYFPVKKQ